MPQTDISSCLLCFSAHLQGRHWRVCGALLQERWLSLLPTWSLPSWGKPRFYLPLWSFSLAGPGELCGSPCPTNTWEINQIHCWQQITVKQEGGELHEKSGIHERYFYDWWKKMEEGQFVFKGNSVQFKHTRTESEIPLSLKYLQSVITGCW